LQHYILSAVIQSSAYDGGVQVTETVTVEWQENSNAALELSSDDAEELSEEETLLLLEEERRRR
jgi:hypothetical protein